MAYINSHKYERSVLEEVKKQREAMAEMENKLAVVLSDNPMPFPEEMPPEPAPVNNRRRRAPENPFQSVPIPEDLLQGPASDSEEDEEDDDAFEEAERDGVRRSSRLKTQRKLRRRLRKRSERIRTRTGDAGEDGEEKSQEGNNEMEIVDDSYEFSDESNEDDISIDSNDSAFEDDTDARAIRRERRERQAAIDAVENRTSRRTRTATISLGDRVRNKKLEKHKKKLSSYPPWLTQTIPHSLIGSYSPQLRDRVVYFRQGHDSYLNEFIEFTNLVPSEVPEVAYCTVKAIKFKVEPFIHCEILLETVIEADLREEYPLYNTDRPAESNTNATITNVTTESNNNNTNAVETNNNNTNAMETENTTTNNENSENEQKAKKQITSPIATRSQRHRSDEDIVEKARRLSLLDVIRNMRQNNRISAYNKTIPTKLEFTVHYHASELPDFLILASRFDQALGVDWQVGNRFRTWMFFQESEQTKQGSWYEGTIVDLSLNTLVSKKKSSERRRSISLNNNNNEEPVPSALFEQVMLQDAPLELAPEVNAVPEVSDDTLLIATKVEPISNNINTNNVEEKAPVEDAAIPEKPTEEKVHEEVSNTNAVVESVQVPEEKPSEAVPEPEKSVRVSPVKIKIRVNPEPSTNVSSEKEEKSEKETETADQNEIELINPWEMLVIKWDEDDDEDEEDHMSPWEVEQLDDAGKKAKTFTIESIDPDVANLIIQEVQERILTMDEVDAFVEPVDVDRYDDYPEFVACPMDVSTICDRLRNNYYRSIDQLKFEIQMIEGNAALYNEENSILVTYAKIIVRKFLDIVRHFEESLSSVVAEPMVTDTENNNNNNTNVMESNTNVPVSRTGGISTVRVVPNDQAYEELINKRSNRRRTRKQRAEHPEEAERENRRERRRETEEQTLQREERRSRTAASRQLRHFVDEEEGSEGGGGEEASDRDNDFDEDESMDAEDDDMDEDGYSDDEDSRGRRRRNQRRPDTRNNNNRPRRTGRSIDDPSVNPYAQRYGVYSYGGSNVHGFNDYRSTRSSSRIQQIQSERSTQQTRNRPAPRVQTRSHATSTNNTINNFNNNNNEGPRIRTLSDRSTRSSNNSNNNSNNRRITVRNLRSGRVLNEPHHEVQPFPSIRRDPTNPLVLRFNSQRRAAAEEATLGVQGRRTRNSMSASLDTNQPSNNNNYNDNEEDEEEDEADDSGSEFESGGRARASSNTRPTRTSARRSEVQEEDDGVRRSSRKRKLNIMLESEDFLHDNEDSSSANDSSKRRSGRLRVKEFIKQSVEEAYPASQRQQHEEEYQAHVTTRRRAESLKEKSASEPKSESEEQLRPRVTTRRRAGSFTEKPSVSEEDEIKEESEHEEKQEDEVKEEQTNVNNDNINHVRVEPTQPLYVGEEVAANEPQTSSDPNELDPSLVEYFASRIRFVFPSAEKPKKPANRKRKRDSEEEEYGGEAKRAPARSNKRRKISEDKDEEEEVDEDEDFSESYDERPKKRQRAAAAPKSNARSTRNKKRSAPTRRRANQSYGEEDDDDDISDEEDFDDDDDDY